MPASWACLGQCWPYPSAASSSGDSPCFSIYPNSIHFDHLLNRFGNQQYPQNCGNKGANLD